MQSMYEFDRGLVAYRDTRTIFHGCPCLFLDRDGVLVEEVNYLHRPEDIVFMPGVAAAIQRVNQAGIAVVMVTNQAGIGRGFYDWEDFTAVQNCIFAHLATHRACFDMVLACAYHAQGIGAYAVADHSWRKPNPGMLLEASRVLGIDLARSFIIGDSLTDLAAGHAAGVAAGALVHTGHGQRDWHRNGETQFHAWRAEGRFRPCRAENATVAIEQWLASNTAL